MDKIWDNGFRQVTTRPKPINSPDDLRDFKLRVPVSPMLLSVFKSLGASPVSINFNELYSALQTRIVDGQENALPLISTAKLYEVEKYCSLTKPCLGRLLAASQPAELGRTAAGAERHHGQAPQPGRGGSAPRQ